MKIVKLESTEKIERVRFNKIIYRRYPQAKGWSDRNYFRCSIGDKRKGFGALHRDIWKFHNGKEIPEGFHIHHKDGNALNNEISNLEALSPKEHRKHHIPTPEQRRAISYIKTLEYRLEKARREAINWHKSEEGRKWHSEHGKRVYKEKAYLNKICEYCKKKFQTKHANTKFCLNKCKSAWRRLQGLDNQKRKCEYCSKTFLTNKFKKGKFCSNICSGKARWIVRKNAVKIQI